jgi:hypothetical protein
MTEVLADVGVAALGDALSHRLANEPAKGLSPGRQRTDQWFSS